MPALRQGRAALRPRAPDQDEAGRILEEKAPVASLPRLALAEYRELVSHIARPTEMQVLDFAQHVAGAKSWYKHLPPGPPGEPFRFFIDPWAGLDRIRMRGSRVAFVHRTAESPRLHYAWLDTADYRARFGRLAFACAAGTSLYMPVAVELDGGRCVSGIFDNNPNRAAMHLSEEEERQIPLEVLEAGTARLTGAIRPVGEPTPAEARERERQLVEMAAAVRRMLDVVYA